MTARHELFLRLTKQDQIPLTESFANLLLDAYAHQLAEQIRNIGIEPFENMNHNATLIRSARNAAANLIDPKEHPMSHEKTDDETTYDTDEWTHDGHDEDQDETD